MWGRVALAVFKLLIGLPWWIRGLFIAVSAWIAIHIYYLEITRRITDENLINTVQNEIISKYEIRKDLLLTDYKCEIIQVNHYVCFYFYYDRIISCNFLQAHGKEIVYFEYRLDALGKLEFLVTQTGEI